jgi:hypothetical protein
MIVDSRTEMCNATALNTGAAGTYVIGNQIDLGPAAPLLGGEKAVYLVIVASAGIEAAGAGSVAFELVSDSVATLDSSATVHLRTPTFATSATTDTTTLKTGTLLFAVQLPFGILNAYERYLGIRQVTASNAITAGSVDIFLTEDVQAWKAYDAPFQL